MESEGQQTHYVPWWQVLLSAMGFYFLGLLALLLTGNPNLFPTVVMLGNFMVPAAYVTFFYNNRRLSHLTLPTTGLTFFYGGVLGVLSASILEPLFVSRFSFANAFVIGLIEEFTKIIGVLIIARNMRHDTELDGLILGAAAGMGFAALESMGYTFTALLQKGGGLSLTVAVTILRGILSPLGHGTWTAILAAVLFREGSANHFNYNTKVIGAYLGVAFLHGLWDGLPGVMSKLFFPGLDIFISQALIGAIGIFILSRLWHEAKYRQVQERMRTSKSATEPDV